MLEINGQAFVGAVLEMRRVQMVIDHLATDEQLNAAMEEDIRGEVTANLNVLLDAIQALQANSAYIAANRVISHVTSNNAYTWKQLARAMEDIESRLKDELGLVTLFAIPPASNVYLLTGPQLLGQTVCDRFPSVIFEMEEAALLIALTRPTASAFHAMRAVEIAIRGLALFLDIPDPTKPTDRNWGTVLKAVKEKIDQKYPAKARMPGSEGARIEALYTTLDAIKNPWRNGTMHAENKYLPHEAIHILQAVNMFLVNLSEICDENGVSSSAR